MYGREGQGPEYSDIPVGDVDDLSSILRRHGD